MTYEQVAQKMVGLIAEYDFPPFILDDVKKRLSDCRDAGYAAQQLRYLENVVKAGMAEKRGRKQ